MRKSNLRSLQILFSLAFLYLLFLFLFFFFEFPSLSLPAPSATTSATAGAAMNGREELDEKFSPTRPNRFLKSSSPSNHRHHHHHGRRSPSLSGLQFTAFESANINSSELYKTAKYAWAAGTKLFSELRNPPTASPSQSNPNKTEETCPHSITLPGPADKDGKMMMAIPCGLTLGSHLTLVGRPRSARPDYDPKIAVVGEEPVMVSQFMIELQGLKTVDGEDPPRILHFNPRLKGDWSGRPVIEQNTCYRMQWGSAQRCEGWLSRAEEETVDELVKCEKWIRDDDGRSEESKTTWWLNRLVGRTRKVSFDWPYPFVEDQLFVLTLSAGLEGYHVSVDGRHVTSFPYRTGFVLEDATGLSLNGDLEVVSIFAASLPTSHPSYSPQRSLEMSAQWQSPPLPEGPIELFIGILSAGNHFAERMAVRKSWMSTVRKSSILVARFFVALHGRKEVNLELKKEAEFFGDIVIVPYMDSYDLVVLKTIAICEYGLRTVSAKYIMKGDDDTFVRIDSVMKEVKKVPSDTSLYVGNMNYYHKPLRFGKWAVTYEEWPEEDYPPYANGPGYVVSSDIAHFIVSEFEKHTLRFPHGYSWPSRVGPLTFPASGLYNSDLLKYEPAPTDLTYKIYPKLFKMEDVSMGMWVEQFNNTRPVDYIHSVGFCQFGCIDDYLTAHYQSPRQMLCMWAKLQEGKPHCCNMR